MWESIEIIDEEFLREVAIREKEKWEALKQATNVVKVVGSRGGFKHLSYEYVQKDGALCHASTGNREEADKLLEFFKENGIFVKEEILR